MSSDFDYFEQNYKKGKAPMTIVTTGHLPPGGGAIANALPESSPAFQVLQIKELWDAICFHLIPTDFLSLCCVTRLAKEFYDSMDHKIIIQILQNQNAENRRLCGVR